MESTKIPFLKKEAKIVLGSVVVQELQSCITLLMNDIDQKELQKKIDNKDFSNLLPAERVSLQLMNVVKQIFKDAQEKGDVYYQDMDETISSSLSL